MHRGGEARRSHLPWRAVGATVALTAAAACGNGTSEHGAARRSPPGSSSEVAAATGRSGDGRASTTEAVPTGPPPTTAVAPPGATTPVAPIEAGADAAPTAATGPIAPAGPAADTAGTAGTGRDADATSSLEGFGTNPRSAPASGNGTALLRAVRVGRHAGFERIVLEFQGRTQPSYRVRWADGPVTADGSGARGEVAGAAHLEVILSPASGVDLTDGTIVYEGPDRVAVADQVVLIQDLVRTGDFEGVLTWAVGAEDAVPFRVLTLAAPTRLVLDLRTPADAASRS